MRTIAAVACLLAGPTPLAAQTCADTIPDPMAGFSPMDMERYTDLSDPDPIRAALPLELSLVSAMINGEHRQVSKTYCQIGVQQMVIDFAVPLEDDSIAYWITRAAYVWDASAVPIGWRLDRLGERGRCARGTDPFAALCP